jgi:nicotinamide riboside kinase
MPEALRIAIVGAESTGKSALARALEARLGTEFGLRAARVDEFLREWCVAAGRTPRPDEQLGIATEQQRRIDAAAAGGAEVVVCDTTPIMIAVYSELLFADHSFVDFARACHARADFTLLTALDLAWVEDGMIRDGPHVREPVDRLVRGHLAALGAPWAVVAGSGAARADNALAALRPLLAGRARTEDAPRGLFGALLAAEPGPRQPPGCALRGLCELCDRGDLEHLQRAALSR